MRLRVSSIIRFESRNILVFFSGVDSLDTLVESDEHTKMTSKKALSIFDFRVKLSGRFGVRCVHVEEEMMLVLKEIRELFSE